MFVQNSRKKKEAVKSAPPKKDKPKAEPPKEEKKPEDKKKLDLDFDDNYEEDWGDNKPEKAK